MSSTQEVRVPDIGDFKDVEVIEVLVNLGDAVAKEQPLITLETEKATMEVPSSAAGTVKELQVKKGDRVSAGTVILLLESESAQMAAESPQKPENVPASAAAEDHLLI